MSIGIFLTSGPGSIILNCIVPHEDRVYPLGNEIRVTEQGGGGVRVEEISERGGGGWSMWRTRGCRGLCLLLPLPAFVELTVGVGRKRGRRYATESSRWCTSQRSSTTVILGGKRQDGSPRALTSQAWMWMRWWPSISAYLFCAFLLLLFYWFLLLQLYNMVVVDLLNGLMMLEICPRANNKVGYYSLCSYKVPKVLRIF